MIWIIVSIVLSIICILLTIDNYNKRERIGLLELYNSINEEYTKLLEDIASNNYK